MKISIFIIVAMFCVSCSSRAKEVDPSPQEPDTIRGFDSIVLEIKRLKEMPI